VRQIAAYFWLGFEVLSRIFKKCIGGLPVFDEWEFA
jgi:hypothetical protein